MIKCNIVQDLIPNYIEDLTSEETNKEIKSHLETCENCKKLYADLKSTASVKTIPTTTDIDNNPEVDHLRAIKKRTFKRSTIAKITAVALAFLLMAGLFVQFSIIGTKVHSDDIFIEIASPISHIAIVFVSEEELKDMDKTQTEEYFRNNQQNTEGFSLYGLVFRLKNKKSLQVKSEYIFESKVLKQIILTPYETITAFSNKTIAYSIDFISKTDSYLSTPSGDAGEVEIIIQLKDKQIKYYFVPFADVYIET